jgi:cell wall-associated NlpC family hydrolase
MRRPATGFVRILCCTLLLAAAPAFAAPGLAANSADQSSLASASQALTDATVLPDRNMLFAADINRLIAVQAQAAPAAQSGRIQSLLKGALALLGTPYRWGGTSPDGGFDCSGLVGYVFRSVGIELPRVSRDMANQGKLISDRAALTAGDLVFFSRRGKRVDHVGIYVGEGRFLHAPRTGKDVEVSSLNTGYWSGKFMQARRVADI